MYLVDTNVWLELLLERQHAFDDGYQYVAAEKHKLTLVSFDGDFDRTKNGRKTPAAIVQAHKAAQAS